MEFNKVVENRKSIRAYKDAEVTKETVMELIKCAQLAPSWKNSQTARFHVVQSNDMLKKMKEEGLSPFNAQRTFNVSTYIVVTFEKDISGFNDDKTPTNECGNGWGYFDTGLAVDHLILKASELGLGTLIMGIRDANRIKEMLDIPDTQIITAVISVGEVDIVPERNPRKESKEVVKFY